MARLALFKYPVAAKAMFNRCEMYNRQMEEIKDRENKKTSFVIRPPEALGISRTENDPQELERVYRMGRKEAEKRLPELRSFLDD